MDGMQNIQVMAALGLLALPLPLLPLNCMLMFPLAFDCTIRPRMLLRGSLRAARLLVEGARCCSRWLLAANALPFADACCSRRARCLSSMTMLIAPAVPDGEFSALRILTSVATCRQKSAPSG